jgi:O-acetylhomoserine/O-acetylserine sulfhydrylase-like pyridoxal-dependent enzyme
MQTIKDAGKEVITSSVLYGYSNELRTGRFRYFYLKRSDLNQKCMKDYNKKI